ncbi:type IV pilin protein [Massilia sp. G4R7]|uniref:Type IV pilin protein n=1 Tax=Massilia phyllostachyos TaxID=2898585 RepID=A0ABS8QBR7_9BURK|nr:type IV pilin protein [Massilia phyllostachyos]MCD2519208.1 type IV pilin protein [Massilia phyllostachyos]
MKRRYGFTLVEVLIVVAILSILTAIAWPGYARHAVKARRTEAQLALVDAMQRQEQYRAQHHSYVAFSASDSEPAGRDFRWHLGAQPESSAYEIDGYACDGQDIRHCIVLRARPGTGRVDTRFRDPDCGVLTFDSTGAQDASGAAPRCWP